MKCIGEEVYELDILSQLWYAQMQHVLYKKNKK